MLPLCSFVAIVAPYRSFDCIKEKLTKDIEEKGTRSSSTHGRKKNAKNKVQQKIWVCCFLNTNKFSYTEAVKKASDSAVFRAVPDQTA